MRQEEEQLQTYIKIGVSRVFIQLVLGCMPRLHIGGWDSPAYDEAYDEEIVNSIPHISMLQLLTIPGHQIMVREYGTLLLEYLPTFLR